MAVDDQDLDWSEWTQVDGHNAPTASLFLRLVGIRLMLIPQDSSTHSAINSWSLCFCLSSSTLDAFSNASITAVLRWNRKSEMLFAFLRRCSKFAGLVASVLRESNLTVRVSAVSLISF